jgi:hypothetical protein
MAYKQIAPTMECKNPRYDYILDTDADAADLPETCATGSLALACDTNTMYIVNASGVWVKLGGGA